MAPRKSKSFNIDVGRFVQALEDAEDVIFEGARQGTDDALELWQLKATNVAPIGRYPRRRGGNLRARIDHTKPRQTGKAVEGEVIANAFNNGFNYGYFIHEVAPGKGYKSREPGTSLTFLDDTLKDNEAQFMATVGKGIEDALKREGWS